MPTYLTASPDHHDWQVSDHAITALIIDPSSVRLQPWTLSASIEIRLGVAFALAVDGNTDYVDPEQHNKCCTTTRFRGR